MKRILTVLTVALVLAAMLVVAAAPAFAGVRKTGDGVMFIYHGSDTTGKFDKKIHHHH